MGETEDVAEALAARYPAAVFDTRGGVASAGFLVSAGLPGFVRIGHRCPFPDSVNGRSFADVAEEETVQVAAYAELLRGHGWTVADRTTNRPRLLVSKTSAQVPHGASPA
ncbi:hypothetical protein [Streptomyces goshikiensis]|uniref:hypothetical protein n=1 Tax=Streptomyces goshikiensis TaxID=1942 RepID=UPI0036776FC6